MHCIFHVTSAVARLELGSQHSNENPGLRPRTFGKPSCFYRSAERTSFPCPWKDLGVPCAYSEKAIQCRSLSGIEGPRSKRALVRSGDEVRDLRCGGLACQQATTRGAGSTCQPEGRSKRQGANKPHMWISFSAVAEVHYLPNLAIYYFTELSRIKDPALATTNIYTVFCHR